ncbi:hypothetical protein K474DRAFT_1663403 [Panus rudis PR-1116 ss-1]|nr:hypothetical protein K474DRAFT_1663403 [Panus rudis PR-1116 ss-1]
MNAAYTPLASIIEDEEESHSPYECSQQEPESYDSSGSAWGRYIECLRERGYTLCSCDSSIESQGGYHATRERDGTLVSVKLLNKEEYPSEESIISFLSSPALRCNPQNHCVPVYDIIESSLDLDHIILVMPDLTQYDDPPFSTVGEVLEFLRQVFEGLEFMHRNKVAYRSYNSHNLKMDVSPLYDNDSRNDNIHVTDDHCHNHKRKGKQHARTTHPVKYYLSDFSQSRSFDSGEAKPRISDPFWSRLVANAAVPEFRSGGPLASFDPFSTDVYLLGDLIRKNFLAVFRRLSFMWPLILAMCNEDPEARPTTDQFVRLYDDVLRKLPWYIPRKRLCDRLEKLHTTVVEEVKHVVRSAWWIARGYPALPTPGVRVYFFSHLLVCLNRRWKRLRRDWGSAIGLAADWQMRFGFSLSIA